MSKSLPFYKQLDAMDCGPTCLKMITKFYGRNFPLQYLRKKCFISRNGVSAKGIIEAAESIGFRCMAVKIPFSAASDLNPSLTKAPLPCIVHWNQNHFVVVYKYNKRSIWIADPANGKHNLDHEVFRKSWVSDGSKGVAIFLETTPFFFSRR